MLKGIDLSYAQKATPPLGGFDFVIVKASQENFTDLMWATHSAAVRKAGLPLLAYHYGKPASVTPIATQVARFLTDARSADYLFLDQEGSMSDADATAFLNLIRKSRECGLYHSSCDFAGTGGGDAQWVADYRGSATPMKCDLSAEFPGWDIWQYTSKGRVTGYLDDLDLNYMNPTSALVTRLRIGREAQIVSLNDRVGLLEAEAAEARDDVTKDDALIADLQKHIAIIESTVSELNETVKEANAQADAVETDRVAARRLLGIT